MREIRAGDILLKENREDPPAGPRQIGETMGKYVRKRLLQLIPILLGITLLSFILTNVSSSDAVDAMESSREWRCRSRRKKRCGKSWDWNRPLAEHYIVWLGNVIRGDMGESFVSGEPVAAAFLEKLPATIELAAASILATVLISVPLGILSAVRQNRFTDYLIRFFSLWELRCRISLSRFLLIYLFSLKLNLLPVMGSSGGLKD